MNRQGPGTRSNVYVDVPVLRNMGVLIYVYKNVDVLIYDMNYSANE